MTSEELKDKLDSLEEEAMIIKQEFALDHTPFTRGENVLLLNSKTGECQKAKYRYSEVCDWIYYKQGIIHLNHFFSKILKNGEIDIRGFIACGYNVGDYDLIQSEDNDIKLEIKDHA